MKKLLLLLILPLFFACSDKDDEEPNQDYTSVTITSSKQFFKSIVAIKEDGVFKKIGDIGKIDYNKETSEIIIPNNIKEVYIFGAQSSYMDRTPLYQIKSMYINRLQITDDTELTKVEDTKDPTQYPQ